MNPQAERRRLLLNGAGESHRAGFLARTISAVGPNARSAAEQVREVMLAVVDNEQAVPDDEQWKTLLPAWFVNACTPEQTAAESAESLRRWQAASTAERRTRHDSISWSLSSWCYWLGENRSWWSWELEVTGETLLWTLLVEEDPVPMGAAEWLVRATGLTLDVDRGRSPRLPRLRRWVPTGSWSWPG